MTSTQKLFSGNPSKWRLQHLHQVWSLQNGNPLVKEHGTLKWTSWRCIPYKNGEFTIAMLVYWSVIHSKRPLRKSTQYGVEKIDSHLCALCLTFIAGTMKDFFILTCFRHQLDGIWILESLVVLFCFFLEKNWLKKVWRNYCWDIL